MFIYNCRQQVNVTFEYKLKRKFKFNNGLTCSLTKLIYFSCTFKQNVYYDVSVYFFSFLRNVNTKKCIKNKKIMDKQFSGIMYFNKHYVNYELFIICIQTNTTKKTNIFVWKKFIINHCIWIILSVIAHWSFPGQ